MSTTMTNDERLAIAEEIIAGWEGSEFRIGNLVAQHYHIDGMWHVWHDPGRKADWQCLYVSACPIEAIYLARQKLAAERDAKKSPRERRLEVILRRMVETVEGAHLHYMLAGVSVKDAKEALKED